jgi:hypothetical protein
MNNLDKKDSLKNKFNTAEISVDPEMKFKINDAMLNSIAKDLPNKEPTLTIWLTSAARFINILYKISKAFMVFCWVEVVKPISRITVKTISTSYKSIKLKRENKEISIAKYLKDVESKLDLKEFQSKHEEFEVDNITRNFEISITKKFDEGVCNVAIQSDKTEYKKATKTIAFADEIFQTISDKLNESRLMSNIDYLNITTTIQKNEINHILEFELKVAGVNWATVFAKFIGSEIQNKIEWVNGHSFGEHTQNLTQIKDVFVFSITHQRLEIVEAVEDIQKYSNTQGKLNEDFSFNLINKHSNQDL